MGAAMRRWVSLGAVLATVWAFPVAAHGFGDADVAALQVSLKGRGLYAGAVDGSLGPGTVSAVRRFQARRGLSADGVLGPATRKALGRSPLGGRVLRAGSFGWDVAALQFLLAWHGFPSGRIDGRFGATTDTALRRFQRWAALAADGHVGPATLAALRVSPPGSPIMLAPPCALAPTEGFGPRGNRFHSGLDYPLARGALVLAAGAGRVTHAGPLRGGWGNVVVIDHGHGVRTWYAHLAAARVEVGRRVARGALIGLAGASGRATGPHLHFEVRVRGASVDPFSALA
jgi:peptidoglycan hydrolase-like protein with peptidoglycan-binding domain